MVDRGRLRGTREGQGRDRGGIREGPGLIQFAGGWGPCSALGFSKLTPFQVQAGETGH